MKHAKVISFVYQMCFSVPNVLFVRVEECRLVLDDACDLASRHLLGCLVIAGESFFQRVTEIWPSSSIQFCEQMVIKYI